MSQIEQFKAAKERINKAKEEADALLKGTFDECLAQLFEQIPLIKSFSWTQYTPYWNDGDTCEFSANTDYPNISTFDKDKNSQDETEEDEYDEDYGNEISSWGLRDMPDGDLKTQYQSVLDFLNTFDSDDYETLFGDHAHVCCSREGSNIEDYDHE